MKWLLPIYFVWLTRIRISAAQLNKQLKFFDPSQNKTVWVCLLTYPAIINDTNSPNCHGNGPNTVMASSLVFATSMYFNFLLFFSRLHNHFSKHWSKRTTFSTKFQRRISVDLLSVGVRRRHLLGALTVATTNCSLLSWRVVATRAVVVLWCYLSIPLHIVYLIIHSYIYPTI